jgi:hypothetical protein
MSANLVAEQCALIPPTELSDRFLWGAVLPAQTSETTLSKQPLVIALFEVTRSWFPESKLVSSLEETLTAAAEQLSLTEPLDDQLESILRAVNGTLNQVSESGETDWIGNINGLIAVLGGDELHFSQTGHCPSYLLSNNRIRQLTESQPVEDLHPLKTFTSLASGSINAGDQLLFATSELYRELSLDALRRTLSGTTPFQSLSTISKELLREKNPRVAAVVVAIHQPSGSRHPQPTTIHLDSIFEPRAKKLTRKVVPVISTLRNRAITLGATALEKAKNLHEITAERRRKPVVEVIKPDSHEAPIGAVVKPTTSAKTPKQVQNLAATIGRFLTRTLPHLLAVWLNRSLLWLQVPQNRRLAALSVGVLIIVLITVGAISRRTSPQVTQSTTETAFTTASEAITRAENALNTNMTDTAARAAEEASVALQSMDIRDGDTARWDELWTKLTAVTNVLSDTTPLTETGDVYNLSSKANSFIVRAPYVYGISASGIERTGAEALANATIALPASVQEPIAASILSSESTTAGYLLTQNSKLLRISQIGSQSTVALIKPEEGEIAPGDTLATYGSNVYVLDGTSGLVWRYTGTGTSFGAGRSLFDPNRVSLRQSISLAIDGSFYVLKRDGSLIKLSGNKQDETFILTGLPQYRGTITNPKQVITDASMSSIYVLDTGTISSRASTARVIELSKEGAFIAQYSFPQAVGDVSAIQVDQRGGKLWALTGTKVVTFSIAPR